MSKSTKSVMLSLLVFPGAGHFYLKKYYMGAILASVSVISVYYILSIALGKAVDISQKIQLGEIQPDIIAITEMISKHPVGSDDAQVVSVATTSIVICWLIGIVDSYRLGRIQDKNK